MPARDACLLRDNGVATRRRPQQRRSEATVEALLECTAALLEARGAAAFSTNLLAAESGISVRAIYRYFPNKQAVLVELAQRRSAEWSAAASAFGDLGDPAADWEDVWRGYIRGWLDAVLAAPGGRALVVAMRDDPVLRAVDDETNRRFIAGIAESLQQRRRGLRAATATTVAQVLLRSTVGVLDDAVDLAPAARAVLVDELLAMHTAYLRHVLREGA